MRIFPACLLLSVLLPSCASSPRIVGTSNDGVSAGVSTGQFVSPAGETLTFAGRPIDLEVAPDGQQVVLKDHRGVVLVDAEGWRVVQELPFAPQHGGGSMHGLAVDREGRRVYASSAKSVVYEGALAEGRLNWTRTFTMPAPSVGGETYPTGLAISGNGTTLFVCLSRNNALAELGLATGEVRRVMPVGVAPYAVALASDGLTAYVSNWGGRHPEPADATADSSGTPAEVDERGVGASGTVSVVDLGIGEEVGQIAVGLHPCGLALSRDGGRLYVANANSDTVSVIDTAARMVLETIPVRPDPQLPFGSQPTDLALDEAHGCLYVTLGGNNAVAVVEMDAGSSILGFIPAGWYPGTVHVHEDHLLVANVKGLGSRQYQPGQKGWDVKSFLGSVSRLKLPVDQATLEQYTQQVRAQSHVPQVLRAMERSARKSRAVPVPRRRGEPSVFEHVVYIIKENRTYDQVFGDLPQGNGDPELCVFGREITPNHHALAEEFVLLDNWYCNGVVSADGHAWATEGNVTGYLEKSFGGFTRAYTFGDDPLSYSSSGFLWDKVLEHGLSFRNFGEMDYAEPEDATLTFTDIYRDFSSGARSLRFNQKIGIERLAQFSAREYPGWNMKIPDVLRARVFLDELQAAEATGLWTNLSIVYLPQDHTSGTKPGMPTPAAHVADNDLALGQFIEGISRSRFWDKTCIFVVEDDPQAGFDHVDGHRSVCLVISPYTKRGKVISAFYNQTSVLHTIARILGTPPLNQMDALAPLMTECFTRRPDFTPYTVRPNNVPLDQINPDTTALSGDVLHWAELSAQQNFEEVDAGDEDSLNRILWHAMKGVDAAYPVHLAGAHGKGLKGLGLQMDPNLGD